MNSLSFSDRPSPEDFVPFTARMMAAMRARESARPDRLFNDPYAAQLAGEAAFEQVDQRLTPQDQAYVAVRTRFFDDFLLQVSAPQVVILASGLDTRAYRLNWDPAVKVYELDYPQVFRYKAASLKDADPACRHYLLTADLTQPWQDQLLATGYRPELPSSWLIEGLLMYLSDDQVHQLLISVSQLAASGSHLGLDLINVASLEYEPYRGFFRYGCDEPETRLSSYGWQAEVLQPGDEGANFGRYPWLPPDRSVANVARVFLIKATKVE